MLAMWREKRQLRCPIISCHHRHKHTAVRAVPHTNDTYMRVCGILKSTKKEMRRPSAAAAAAGGPFSSSTTRAIVEIATSRRALRLIALFALLAFLLAFSLVPSSATTTTVPEVTGTGGSDGTSASPHASAARRASSHTAVWIRTITLERPSVDARLDPAFAR